MMKFFLFVLILVAGLSYAQETGARYLIITYDDYAEYLKPLADWKTQKGMKAKIVSLSEIGSSDSIQIKNYIVNAYNTWHVKPEFLLIVGNRNQVPFPQFVYGPDGSNSDNYYTNVTGDFHNEILPGRLWVFDTLDVKTIVAKILGYEKTPYVTDTTWFKKGTTIVCEDEYGIISDSIYWSDARYAHGLMNSASFIQIDSFSKYRGNTSIDLINAWNDGRSYMLYRGLGVATWDWPFWDIDTSQMYNGFKLPVIISATCATIEGIGYQWTNAGSPEEPKGAVGFYGTTTALFDAAAFRSALARGTLQSIFHDRRTTLGKAAEAGRLNYVGIFGNTLEYDSWTCLGDPEMTLWTSSPKSFQVTHTPYIATGICTINVNVQYNSAPMESISVCIMGKDDHDIYGVGYTDIAGNIRFIDTASIICDTVFITVTHHNFMPFIGTLVTHFLGGPHVGLNSFSISDVAGGNGDSIANPGENIEIPLWVRNWGDSTAHGVSGVVREAEQDLFFDLEDTLKYFGDIQPSDSAFTSPNGFNALIASKCLDLHEIEICLTNRESGGTAWNSIFRFTVHAPVISCLRYYFPNFMMSSPAGDTNYIVAELMNNGTYRAETLTAGLFSPDTFITILDSLSDFSTILPESTGSNLSNPFVILTDANTPVCHPVNMKMVIKSGVYIDTFDLRLYIGQKDYLVWDADLNHTSGPVIKAMLDSLGFYGDYALQAPNGLYSLYRSVFICAGLYPYNYIIKDTSRVASDIPMYLNLQGGKIYMEGGDVWYGDPHSNHGFDFNPLFKVNPLANSIGAFPGVNGIAGTFTDGMHFRYSGEVTMMDNIDSLNGSQTIFRSTNWDHGCAVAADHRTVGMSCEFAGFVDTVLPSTKLVLMDSIMRYFGLSGTGVLEGTGYWEAGIGLVVYPNPFMRSAQIKIQIPSTKSQTISNSQTPNPKLQPTLKIYDATGRHVKSFLLPTTYSLLPTAITWQGTDDAGRMLPTGIYFISLNQGDVIIMKKIILIR